MALTPFDLWAGWMRNSAAMMQTGFRFAEMAQASGAVIDSRLKTISKTMASGMTSGDIPSVADQRELARMVPEKIEAFSLAGMAAFGDMVAMQAEAIAAWQQMLGMAMSHRPPTLAEIETLTRRGNRMTDRAVAASGKALAPIHRQATGNARRLARDGTRDSKG
jgi:hypothetical protein